MPSTAEERAARRESRKANDTSRRPGRNQHFQGYQSESARLFALSIQSSNDSSNLLQSSNDSTALDTSASERRPVHSHSRSLSGIEEGLDCSDDNKNTMQPPGQDAAQGGSPRHRAGPFEKDSEDDYYEESGGGDNMGGGTNPFLDDSDIDNSPNGRGVSTPEREFQPAKLDRSASSAKSGRGVGESFDTDDDAPSKTRPPSFAASAVTTSSSATQRVANSDGDDRKKTARDKFMEIMPDDDDDDDDRGEATVDYGTPLYNPAGRSPFDDDSDDQASQGSYEQPRSFRPFSGGSQSSSMTGGEHLSSMQELLEEERSRSFMTNKPGRFAGCLDSCLGGKRTKRRKITLLLMVLLVCAVIAASVSVVLLGQSKGKSKNGQVDSQSMQQIERPGTNFVPGNTGNTSSVDNTFGMADNTTDDIFDFEPTFPDGSQLTGGETSNVTTTASPISASSMAPTPSISESIASGFKPTLPPSDSPTTLVPELLTGSPSVTTMMTSYPPTESPAGATFQPIGTPSAAPFTSTVPDLSGPPTTVAPVLSPTNPPISTSVPSVQTDISGVLTFTEPVPQDTEANLIAFLDALKKSIRATLSSSLEANDELIYVEILSINGETVDSLLLRRRFIRRRLQFGSLVTYEIVVLTDCDLPDCSDAETIASDVFSRTTNQISSSVFSGEFASILEVNVLSSSGGAIVDYMTGIEAGDFTEPKVTVLIPTGDEVANETSYTNSTIPADSIVANETEPIDSTATGGDGMTPNTCKFCIDGMPDPFLVVSDSGLNCNQLKEAVDGRDSTSDTCITVKQAEGLCCAVSPTVPDIADDTLLMNSTIVGDETNSTNTAVDVVDMNATDTSSMNYTIIGNYTDVSSETAVANSTFYQDTPMFDNGTVSEPVIDTMYPDDSNGTISTNMTDIEDFDEYTSGTTLSNWTENGEVGTNETISTPTSTLCQFCEDGMPDPFLVVSDSGLNCNQLKVAVTGRESDSNTCISVKQAEGLCCEVPPTVPDIADDTLLMNSTEDGVGDMNATQLPFTNTTMISNDTIVGSDSTSDFVIVQTMDGNETFISYEDMPIMFENGTVSDPVNDAFYPDLLCPDSLTRSIDIDEFASLFYAVVPSSPPEARNGIFCARLQVQSLGWVGFALSKDGSMVGSEAIIAHPFENTILKYSLLGKIPDAIVEVDDEHQTLRETSIVQDFEAGITTMNFVKYIDEFDEIPILLKGPNHFLYARGGSNVFGYHLGRKYFMKDFAEDGVAVDVDNNGTLSTNTTAEDLGTVFDYETVVTDMNHTEPSMNSTPYDFVIIDTVVGNETIITYGEKPIIETKPNVSVVYSDSNSTMGYSTGSPALSFPVNASNDVADPENETDFDDPTAILDVLSLPYILADEFDGVSSTSRFGFSVAMSSDGSIVAVGAKDTTDAVFGEVGAVHIYSMLTSPPTLIQTLVSESPLGEFGNSIGLSNDGSRLVVGARSENDQTGVVRVYGRDIFGQWALLGMPINGVFSGERAGWSVSISGDGSSVAVGAPKGGGSAGGSVVTYRFENGSWVPYGSALEGVLKEAFGYTTSMSYDGNVVAVGSPKALNLEGASNAGKTSVFYLYGSEWIPLPLPAKNIHGVSSNDISGSSIAMSDDGAILVVGGKGRDNAGGVSNVGHCRIYEFEVGTDWDLLHTIEGQSENERLGSSVAVSKNGNVVACGGETAMFDGVGIGVVRVWNRETSESSAVWPRSSDNGALFGSALSLSEDGKVLAVGAPERNSKTGALEVYEHVI